MNQIKYFVKKETVLSISALLAVISLFLVPPDASYADYIDLRTLAILFCLMAVMAGFQQNGLFSLVAQSILGRVKNMRQILFVLVLLCFISSMLITNDVALITFVPLTMIVFDMLGKAQKKWLIPAVVMQTIAANLGSMLTPLGNPQNLYLYGKSGSNIADFLLLMLPFTLASLVFLCVWILISCRRENTKIQVAFKQKATIQSSLSVLVFSLLFLICLLSVLHVIPWKIAFIAVLLSVTLYSRNTLKKVDYFLLLTFISLFIFIGNVGRIPVFHDALTRIMDGHETITAIIASQFMSNVPAAILLSGFTNRYSDLVIGVNLGGLGTLIASMASLISFKFLAKEMPEKKGAYLLYFTISNLIFLGLLLGMYTVLNVIF
ncbi:MAG: SLC13 family permease [Eubacterium sp.]